MKAVVYRNYGPPEALELTDVPVPSPGPDDVLIRVQYAGVNPIDWKIGEGRMQANFDCTFPLIVGRELAGVVETVGSRVNGFKLEDKVISGLPRPGGAFAEFAAVPASYVAKAPKRISLKESAALPLVALTCWQSLIDKAGLAEGQSVFILSGAGGTGSLAIQFAKEIGATVVATCGPANQAYVRNLGAHEVYDYTRDDVIGKVREQFPDGVDVAFSNVLGDLHERAFSVVKSGGTLITIGEAPIPALAHRMGIREIDHVVYPNGEQLTKIAQWIDGGRLNPPSITEFPLTQTADALRTSINGHVRGKIVLRIV